MTTDEIVAIAMLLGEPPPDTCGPCGGSGWMVGGFLGVRPCRYCEGTGLAVGPKTSEELVRRGITKKRNE